MQTMNEKKFSRNKKSTVAITAIKSLLPFTCGYSLYIIISFNVIDNKRNCWRVIRSIQQMLSCFFSVSLADPRELHRNSMKTGVLSDR